MITYEELENRQQLKNLTSRLNSMENHPEFYKDKKNYYEKIEDLKNTIAVSAALIARGC